MTSNINSLSRGKEVWWNDPAGETSGAYTVEDIRYDSDGMLHEDTIILISNGTSEAEVTIDELQDLDARKEHIAKFVDRIIEVAESDDWSVYNHDKDYTTVDLYISKYSSAGQDFGFYIECKTGVADEFINALEGYYNSYDPSEEASLWIGPDGHGINKAPDRLEDILEDMKECKSNVRRLIDLLKRELQSVKYPKISNHTQYSERLYKIREEVIEDIKSTLSDICKANSSLTVLWSKVTDGSCTDIVYETDRDTESVLPEVIGFEDTDYSDFFISFASYCDCSPSINGENIYTETLIDILEYLENYRSNF